MKSRKVPQLIIAVVGIAFIITGLYNGGFNDVMQKAIRICLECIGIG